jgi:hypothetical protein
MISSLSGPRKEVTVERCFQRVIHARSDEEQNDPDKVPNQHQTSFLASSGSIREMPSRIGKARAASSLISSCSARHSAKVLTTRGRRGFQEASIARCRTFNARKEKGQERFRDPALFCIERNLPSK